MKERLLKSFSNIRKKNEKSFYSALFLSFFAISIISTLLLTAFLTVNFFNSISSSTKRYNSQLLEETNYTIDQMQENIDLLTASLLSNDTITAFLSLTSTENTNIPVLASREVNSQLTTLSYLDSIYLYNAEMDLLYASNSGYQQNPSDFENQTTIARIYDKNFIDTYEGQPVPSGEILTYYIFDTYSPNPGRKSAIIINVKTSTLTDSIVSMKRFTDKTKSNFLLLDSDMTYLAGVLNDDISSQKNWVNHALKSITSEKNLDSSYIEVNGTTYFLTHTDKNIYDWNLYNLLPARILFQDILKTALFGLLIWIVTLIFIQFICQRFARRLNEPIEQLTTHLKEIHNNSGKTTTTTFKTKEFKNIVSSVSSLLKNNEQLRLIQQKSRYSLTQSSLNDFVDNRQIAPASFDLQKLDHLNIRYLIEDKLCMVVFKLDNYHSYLTERNPDDLWAIQFSIVNIIEELASTHFKCNAFSRNDDKFVLLVSCASETDLVAFEDKLVLLIQDIQKKTETYLHLTMTAAYSIVFQGGDKFPVIYQRVRHSLLLKMRYGHNAIIDPYQIDEVLIEPFQLSNKVTNQLFSHLANGRLEDAWDSYIKLTENLFCYDYDEITATLIYLAHGIYGHFIEKYPMLKDSASSDVKAFLTQLEYAEVSEDIQHLTRTFFEMICSAVQQIKETSAEDELAVVAEKIAQIITEQYSDSSLCLAAIADKIGFSPNYTGQIFKQYAQKSVAQYLLEVRMEKIAHYLQTTSLPLNRILGNVGLELNNYFYTRFKNYFGMPLSEYRQQFQNTEKKE